MTGNDGNKMPMTLRIAREMAGLTPKEAAKTLKIKEKTLKNYEMGVSFPRVSVLKRIESLYGVGYDQIIFLPKHFG